MKNRIYILLILFAGMFVLQAGYLYADGPDTSEYKMKAAYIYKFMQFVQLPERKRADDRGKALKIVVVGVTDKDLLTQFRGVIGAKEVTQRKTIYRIVVEYVDIKQFEDKRRKPALDILFIKDTTKYDPRKLLEATVENNILTFGETKAFLEAGGIVNFVIVKNKLKFEINTGTAERTGIKIRSQLLKLAQKIIDKQIKP